MRMRTFTTLFCSSLVVLLLSAGPSWAVIALQDEFDDGDIDTNTLGIGNGFNSFIVPDPNTNNNPKMIIAEDADPGIADPNYWEDPNNTAGGPGLLLQQGSQVGGNGNRHNQIATKVTFPANTSNTLTTTWTINEFGRPSTVSNGTSRFFLGLVDSNDCANGLCTGSPFQSTISGLWVGLQFWDDAASINGLLQDNDGNGKGALVYTFNNTNTVLAEWEWDQSLVSWDTGDPNEPQGRSDRIMQRFNDPNNPLVLELVSDDVGYELNFSSTGSATLPSDISGTWAGVDPNFTNELSSVHVVSRLQSNNFGRMILDSILVETDVSLQPQGDINGDFITNSVDFDLLMANMFKDVDGGSILTPREQGDLNDDGVIDVDDYRIYKDDPALDFFASTVAVATAVPEPSSVSVGLIGCLYLLTRRRLRR